MVAEHRRRLFVHQQRIIKPWLPIGKRSTTIAYNKPFSVIVSAGDFAASRINADSHTSSHTFNQPITSFVRADDTIRLLGIQSTQADCTLGKFITGSHGVVYASGHFNAKPGRTKRTTVRRFDVARSRSLVELSID